MKERRTFMKRLMAMILVLVMVLTSQNLTELAAVEAAMQEMVIQSEVFTYVSDVELPDNEELFEGYVDKEFYGEIATFGYSAGKRLEEGAAYNLYDYLKMQLKNIADGTQASAAISFDPESLGGKSTFESMSFEEAQAAFIAQFDMSGIFDALLHDCPYELYWHDKTTGISYGYSMSAMGSGPTYDKVTIVDPYITFAVAGNYQSVVYDAEFPSTDVTKTSVASKAVDNAKTIVENCEGLDDYHKLVAYRDKICELVEYDHDAVKSGSFSKDNDPWQLIHVFDGDTSTNVVCEGYSKAFQYLCDLSTFELDVNSYIVTGTMTGGTGAGGHMWNIVTMEDGNNYIVDITNSDAGSIGQNGGLFLAGTAGDIVNGYTFALSSNIVFKYYDDEKAFWGTGDDSILKLAEADYEYVEQKDKLKISGVTIVNNSELVSEAVLPEGITYDHATRTITLTNAIIELSKEQDYCLIEGIGDYKIQLKGYNSMSSASDLSEKEYAAAIDIDGNLTIEGTGRLIVDVSGMEVANEAYGIRALGKLTIDGVTVNVVAGDIMAGESIDIEDGIVATDKLYSDDDVTYADCIIISKESKLVDVYGAAKLMCDLELEAGYEFRFNASASLTLGEYVIAYADGGALSDENLESIADEVALLTLADGIKVYYGDFEEAYIYAGVNNDSTLTLLADVNEQFSIDAGIFTIDMNGYDIAVEVDDEYVMVVGGLSEVTIKDDSEAKTSVISNTGGNDQSGFGILNSGKLYLEGVQCKVDNGAVENYGEVHIKNSVIEGGGYALTNYSDAYIDGSTLIGLVDNMEGDMYISGNIVCTIASSYMGDVYITGALSDEASITYAENNFNFDEVVKPANGYTITESDADKFTHIYADKGLVFGVNDSNNIQVYGDLSKAIISITQDGFVYSGTANTVEEEIVFEFTKLIENTDYTVEYADNTNAGEATIKVKGKGNYIGTCIKTFYISEAVLMVDKVNVDNKTYDGKTDAVISSVEITGMISGETLKWGTDYTVTAKFTDAGAGEEKQVEYTITLLDTEVAKNYAFEDGSKVYTGKTTATIEKAAAPVLSIEAQNVNFSIDNYTCDIAQLVTGLPDDAGNVEYYLDNNSQLDGWSLSTDGQLSISKLSENEGNDVTGVIKVSSTNYEDTTVDFTIVKVAFVYGDANSDGKINVIDAVLIKKNIAGFDNLKINLEASDVKADGKINVMDAVLLLKYIAGFDVKLGVN